MLLKLLSVVSIRFLILLISSGLIDPPFQAQKNGPLKYPIQFTIKSRFEISRSKVFHYISGASDLTAAPMIFIESFSFPIVSGVTTRHFAIVS